MRDIEPGCVAIPFFRHVEFRGAHGQCFWPAHIMQARSSKLRTVVPARENLPYQWSLRSSLERVQPTLKMSCVGLGLYGIESREALRDIYVKDFEMAAYLPERE